MRRIHLASTLTTGELEKRYRAAKEPVERSWWQILWLLSQGQTAIAIAKSTGYSAAWIGQLAKRYNAEGPAGMVNRQQTRVRATPTLLSSAQLEELRVALAGPAPDGARWSGRRGRRVDGPASGPRGVLPDRVGLPAATEGAAAAAASTARGGERRGAGGI